MSPRFVSIPEISAISGLTEKHIRRVVLHAQTKRRKWHRATLEVREFEAGPKVAFFSLPEKIREAFIMQDQMEFPFDHGANSVAKP